MMKELQIKTIRNQNSFTNESGYQLLPAYGDDTIMICPFPACCFDMMHLQISTYLSNTHHGIVLSGEHNMSMFE